jgi:hypothetical protein
LLFTVSDAANAYTAPNAATPNTSAMNARFIVSTSQTSASQPDLGPTSRVGDTRRPLEGFRQQV